MVEKSTTFWRSVNVHCDRRIVRDLHTVPPGQGQGRSAELCHLQQILLTCITAQSGEV